MARTNKALNEAYWFRDFTREEREALAKKGAAMPDKGSGGAFPIENCGNVEDAVRAIGRASDPAAAKAHIIKMAKKLGCTDKIPDDWTSTKSTEQPDDLNRGTGDSDNDTGQADDDGDSDDFIGRSDSDTDQPDQDGDADDNKGTATTRVSGTNFSLEYMRGMRDELKPYVTPDVFNKAVRTVRARVGGRARAASRAATELFDLDELELIFSEDEPDFGEVELIGKASSATFSVGSDSSHSRLFNALQDYSEPPTWIPYLPKPGEYAHARYGTLKVTNESNGRFVQNFKDQVYQPWLPIDAEHNSKLSGALAWVTDMRQNLDGSVDGKAQWTPRGRQLMEGDAFRYFSPEIYDEWEDPATGTKHQHVAIGGALTTRPFFKHNSLRPLVASEEGTMYAPVVHDDKLEFTALRFSENEGGTDMPDENKKSGEAPKDFAEFKLWTEQQFSELKGERDTYKAMADKYEGELKATTEVATAAKKDLLRQKYTEMVMGHGGDNDGARWFGEVEANVNLLMDMAEKFGEESDQFKAYADQQKKTAIALLASPALNDVGSPRQNAETTTADDKVSVIAKAFQEKDPTMTFEQAYDRALQTPEGQKAYSEFKSHRKDGV